jgi:hypothetical protein
MAGCQAAYYLVHSLSDPDFERKDGAAATAFGQAAARAGLQRIIYLGGLGDDQDALSAHLRSRRRPSGQIFMPNVRAVVLRYGPSVLPGAVLGIGGQREGPMHRAADLSAGEPHVACRRDRPVARPAGRRGVRGRSRVGPAGPAAARRRATRERWAVLADLAGEDLSMARLAEGHADALGILAELGHAAPPAGTRWGSGPRSRPARGGERALETRTTGTSRWPGSPASTGRRVNPDGTIEALESPSVEATEEATMFVTLEGIVMVIRSATRRRPG